MTSTVKTVRVPLTLRSAVATFGIGTAGYLAVNLSPYMIAAMEDSLGTGVVVAGWAITATLLTTAITCLLVARLSAGNRRLLVARLGLGTAALGFGFAALVPLPALVIAGLVLGGAGAGGALAASSASVAAFLNPDRVSGLSGLSDRATITVILAVVPLAGLAPFNVFGTIAIFCLVMLLATGWLPRAPITHVELAEQVGLPLVAGPRKGRRVELIAGFGLLATFAFFALSEDSLWAMVGFMGYEQAGLSDAMIGFALSLATAGGFVGAVFLSIVGDRLGRAVPLVILLVVGGTLKIIEGTVTDPTVFVVLLVSWSAVYATTFLYFVATSAALDADGRWSGSIFAIYLIGSSFAPAFSSNLVELLGYSGFMLVLGIMSFALVAPAFLIARASTRLQRMEAAEAELTSDSEVVA